MSREILFLALIILTVITPLGICNFHVVQRIPGEPPPVIKTYAVAYPIFEKYVSLNNCSQEIIVQDNCPGIYCLYVFTPQTYCLWSLGHSENAIFSTKITKGTYVIPLNKGNYVVVINHFLGKDSNINVNVAPRSFCSFIMSNRLASPRGIVSYGIYDYAGELQNYCIRTNSILGYFNISCFEPKGCLASLQLNAVLLINGGNDYEYFLQNIIKFENCFHWFYLEDNIWNFSSYRANIYHVEGKGIINSYCNRTYYCYSPPCLFDIKYSLPLAGYLIINVTTVQGKGVYVTFGFSKIQNGQEILPPIFTYYDKVFISCPNVISACIVIKPNFTKSLNVFSAGLVFGSYEQLSTVSFNNLNSTLALLYCNQGWKPVPSFFSFCVNSLESACNLNFKAAKSKILVSTNVQCSNSVIDMPHVNVPFTFVDYNNKPIYIEKPLNVSLPRTIYICKNEKQCLYKVYLCINGIRQQINDGYIIYPRCYFISINITAFYNTYYFIRIFYPNGTFCSWFLSCSKICLPKIIQVCKFIRYNLNQNSTIMATGPLNITPIYELQYLVTINLPTNKTEEWVNNGTIIQIPKTIYINAGTRYYLLSSNESYVSKPLNITPIYELQYLVKLILPNGTIEEWVNNGTIIQIPKTIYINSTSRYYLNNTNTSFIICRPMIIKPCYKLQYLVKLILPNGTIEEWLDSHSDLILPKIIQINDTRYILNEQNNIIEILGCRILCPKYDVYYLVKLILPNGTIEEWVKKDCVIILPQYIYISSYERYVLNSTQFVIVHSPLVIQPEYIKQYLININGISYWYNQGAKLLIKIATTPFFIVKWVGSIKVTNGEIITINGPLDLKAEILINPLFEYLGIAGIIAIIVLAITNVIRHKSK
ncbi:thermopsin domain protein [Acidianus hospitalis W1]|uniref:Thermopsin domain protein n=1 Tax=Acidianus hospitalis (strain W1) TaxID=933801 RepID=F4B877_ACIHW|nr:thermopsin domain protein [Acidianus hospitalis W1]